MTEKAVQEADNDQRILEIVDLLDQVGRKFALGGEPMTTAAMSSICRSMLTPTAR